MLNVPKFSFLVFIITALSICWVHQQVELVTTSYKISEKERKIVELNEVGSYLQYRVLRLESPSQLYQKLYEANQSLNFRKPTRLARLKSQESTALSPELKSPKRRSFWEFFIRSAEAKQAQESSSLD